MIQFKFLTTYRKKNKHSEKKISNEKQQDSIHQETVQIWTVSFYSPVTTYQDFFLNHKSCASSIHIRNLPFITKSEHYRFCESIYFQSTEYKYFHRQELTVSVAITYTNSLSMKHHSHLNQKRILRVLFHSYVIC